MKTKPKTVKIKNINSSPINQELKAIDENGYPIPKKVTCFDCEKEFYLTFSFSRKNYSLKNSLFYWTSNEKFKDKWRCSPCLKKICSNLDQRKEFLKTIPDSKKGHLRSYLTRNII